MGSLGWISFLPNISMLGTSPARSHSVTPQFSDWLPCYYISQVCVYVYYFSARHIHGMSVTCLLVAQWRLSFQTDCHAITVHRCVCVSLYGIPMVYKLPACWSLSDALVFRLTTTPQPRGMNHPSVRHTHTVSWLLNTEQFQFSEYLMCHPTPREWITPLSYMPTPQKNLPLAIQ